MVNKQNGKILVVKRSCLTGRIVWMYHGTSEEAARKAYWRACKKEVWHIRNWTKRNSRRRRLLLNIVMRSGISSESSTSFKQMNPEKRKLVRKIIQLANGAPTPDRGFYNHIIEEAKRRNWFSDRWGDSRMKMVRYGLTYIESECQAKKRKNK